MKCQYCGSNLELTNEVCPFCGRENKKAKKYLDKRNDYQKEFDETKQKVKGQVKINARTGRLILIALMGVILVIMAIINSQSADVSTRIERGEEQTKRIVEKNLDSISASLKEMEKNREYLEMEYFVLSYRLGHHDEFSDYTRVFTAVSSYTGIFESILSVASGYDYFGEKDAADWCRSIARSVTTWNMYVDGEFWRDTADSPMHTGEHGAFLADIKEATHDMVQVYFELTDEQADAMWSMEEEELAKLLFAQYMSISPEVSDNE